MGLNFNITAEQEEFLDLAEQFTKNEIIPVAPHYDRTGEYPWPVLKKAHETGLMNLHIPQVFYTSNLCDSEYSRSSLTCSSGIWWHGSWHFGEFTFTMLLDKNSLMDKKQILT